MKINGPHLEPAGELRRKPPLEKQRAAAPRHAAPASRQADEVEITPVARGLAALQAVPEVRTEAIERAARLIDETGNVHDEDALRQGLWRLIRMLQEKGG